MRHAMQPCGPRKQLIWPTHGGRNVGWRKQLKTATGHEKVTCSGHMARQVSLRSDWSPSDSCKLWNPAKGRSPVAGPRTQQRLAASASCGAAIQ
eukprot:6088234-Prymnesium_polylepis.1